MTPQEIVHQIAAMNPIVSIDGTVDFVCAFCQVTADGEPGTSMPPALYPHADTCLWMEAKLQSIAPGKAKLVIEVQDSHECAMDSGCLHDILQTAVNHGGTVTVAYYELNNGEKTDLMHFMEGITQEEGKC